MSEQLYQSRPDKNPITTSTPPDTTANPNTANKARARTSTNDASYNTGSIYPTTWPANHSVTIHADELARANTRARAADRPTCLPTRPHFSPGISGRWDGPRKEVPLGGGVLQMMGR